MHEQRIRHKDIKPHNVLVHSSAVIFTDFGSSLDSSQISHSTTEGTPSAYTRRYAAPEVLEHEERSSSSDVWSLGCVLLEVLSSLTNKFTIDEERPYSETIPHIHETLQKLSFVDEYGTVASILAEMTCLEAEKRPTSKTLRTRFLVSSTLSCTECFSVASFHQNVGVQQNAPSRDVAPGKYYSPSAHGLMLMYLERQHESSHPCQIWCVICACI